MKPKTAEKSDSTRFSVFRATTIASIPFFAMLRVDNKTQSMTVQPDDPINTQISFQGNGQEQAFPGRTDDISYKTLCR